MHRPAVQTTGTTGCLAIQGESRSPCPSWGTGRQPRRHGLIEHVGVHPLQEPPDRGLTRRNPADAQLRAQQRGQVHGPIGDRDERPGSGQDRAGTQAQYRDEPMPDTATLTRIRHGTQSLQQPLRRHRRHRAEASGVANGRGDQRRYTSGHGDGSGDRYGCEEPLMITGRAVSALLLHDHRRVVVRRAVNYDFAGALRNPLHKRLSERPADRQLSLRHPLTSTQRRSTSRVLDQLDFNVSDRACLFIVCCFSLISR